LERRRDIKLPLNVEALLDPGLKDQLRAIAARVSDLVAAGLRDARAAAAGADPLEPLLTAHAAALRIFESELEGYFHNVPGGPALKRSLACTAGCAFCCHLQVQVTALEAIAIAATLRPASHTAQRSAIAATVPRVRGLSVDARRAARIPCALLIEGMCSVYQTRPVACRALYSTDAKACEQVLMTPLGAPLPPIRSPAVPRALADTFAAGVNAALAEHGLQTGLFELTAALDALLRDPGAARRWLAGEPVLPTSAR
jgi:Fe-S-cluster containining protein